MTRRLKWLAKVLLGREPWLRRDLRVPTERLGGDYGGWTICPLGLGPDSVVYSFGVGEDVSFDLALIERFGATVHAFDPTPRSAQWVARQHLPKAFRFHPLGVLDRDGTVEMSPPADSAHVSHSVLPTGGGAAIEVPVRRLPTILEELGHTRIDLLKMDVEGAEYGVLDDLLASGVPVTQLLVEFHHRFPGVGARRTVAAVAELRRHGFGVFHVTPGGEVSLLRRG